MYPRSGPQLSRTLAAATLACVCCAPLQTRADALEGHYRQIHALALAEGQSPSGRLLVLPDGGILGTASFGGGSEHGTVFVLKPGAHALEVVHSFAGGPHDGALPAAGLTLDAQGIPWGTTQQGGASNAGTVYRIVDQGVEIVHMFGKDPKGNGKWPVAGLMLASDGMLYGTTSEGGVNGAGIVFRVEADGSVTSLWDMDRGAGGKMRGALLQASDGLLYGTAAFGGSNAAGAVFSLALDGGSRRILHSFDRDDGEFTDGGVTEGSDHRLYGTTSFGGPNDCGVVYRIDRDGSNFTLLHAFTRDDGFGAHGELVETSPGLFVGTTAGGGRHEQGTVFQVTAAGDVTVLYSFSGAAKKNGDIDGGQPIATPTPVGDRVLLGVTQSGGGDNDGTVFKLRAD